jgi:hypothetical protein
MEIYKNSNDPILLEIPAHVMAGTTNATVRLVDDGGVVLHDFPQVTAQTTGKTGYKVTLPWHVTQMDQDLFLEWRLEYTDHGSAHVFRERQLVNIVTPILDLSEFEKINDSVGVETQEDTHDLERRVRYAIQAYTGQEFGRYRATYEVRGTGGLQLLLPAPLLEVERADFPVLKMELFNGGTTLAYPTDTWFGIKDAPPEEILDQFYYTNGPIRVSNNYSFADGRRFKISGVWGYHDVPGDVKQAARLLAADFACDESLWRDRYMDSVRAGNWRFEVNELSFQGTGNVVVDQILAKYRKISLVAV